MELRQCAVRVLCITDPVFKADQARELQARCAALPIAALAPAAPGPLPGRPARPELIHPAQVPRRSPFKPEGLAALLHAIAHIEFNAINQPPHVTAFHGVKELMALESNNKGVRPTSAA